MPLDFPANPTDGQVYPAAPNSEYIYSTSKGAWLSLPTESAKTVTSDNPPSNPKDGDQWFNTTDANLYIYYVDVDGGQWVQIKNDASFSSNIGPRVDALEIKSPNYIINGAFDIWQRGTSITGTNNVYGPDRWQGYGYATNSVTLQQIAFTPGTAPLSDVEGQFHVRITSTNTRVWLTQHVENVRTLENSKATVSFWVKSASAQTGASVYLSQYTGVGGTGSGDLTAQTFDVGTTWQRVSKTFDVPSLVGKTVGADSRLSVTITGAINNALDVWGVQLEAGAVATTFRRNSPNIQAELAACQRYYYRNSYSGSVGENFYCWLGTRGGSSTTLGSVSLPVEMRAIPTISMSGLAFKQLSGGNVTVNNTVTYNPSTKQTASFEFARTSGTWPGESLGLLYGGSGSYIDFSAEL